MSLKNNPFINRPKHKHGAVPFDNIKQEHFIPALDYAIQEAKQKLEEVKKRIKSLEQSWQGDGKDSISIKLLQKQKKQYQLEYQAILKTLSIMLVAIQNGQLYI